MSGSSGECQSSDWSKRFIVPEYSSFLLSNSLFSFWQVWEMLTDERFYLNLIWSCIIFTIIYESDVGAKWSEHIRTGGAIVVVLDGAIGNVCYAINYGNVLYAWYNQTVDSHQTLIECLIRCENDFNTVMRENSNLIRCNIQFHSIANPFT